jgi:hypothetical protein
MRPIPDWRSAWRYYSTQAMIGAAALQGAWMAIPDDLRANVPDWTANAITGAILVFGIVGRLVDQAPERPE